MLSGRADHQMQYNAMRLTVTVSAATNKAFEFGCSDLQYVTSRPIKNSH
jgi:hypothetical protein